MRFWFIALLVCCSLSVLAQEDSAAPTDLVATSTTLTTQLSVFGVEETLVTGTLTNNGFVAYKNISLIVEGRDSDGTLIGEGFGFVVDACGIGLIDFALQPTGQIGFQANFEQFEPGDVAELVVIADATPTDPVPLNLSQSYVGLRGITSDEVVQVEWIDNETLRYGVGCDGEVFTRYDWYEVTLSSGTPIPIDHPAEVQVTDALIQQTGLNVPTQGGEFDLFIFENSQITFRPDVRRIVYQNDLHTIFSAEPDGSFKRLMHERLHQYTLRGFNWQAGGIFTAYYFGAYDEPVFYFVGNTDGEVLSALLTDNPSSVTVPSSTEDGRFLIVGGGSSDGVRGYYLQNALFPSDRVLLFEAELPGNNYPAPVYVTRAPDNRVIYLVRDVDGQATLQCFHRESITLSTLTPLPLNLDNEERAWTNLSPNRDRLAVYANGLNGGLWWVDLSAFEVCR